MIIPLFEPEGDNKEQLASLNAQAAELDKKLDGALSEMISSNELKGKPGSSSLVRLGKSAPVSKFLFRFVWFKGEGWFVLSENLGVCSGSQGSCFWRRQEREVRRSGCCQTRRICCEHRKVGEGACVALKLHLYELEML